MCVSQVTCPSLDPVLLGLAPDPGGFHFCFLRYTVLYGFQQNNAPPPQKIKKIKIKVHLDWQKQQCLYCKTLLIIFSYTQRSTVQLKRILTWQQRLCPTFPRPNRCVFRLLCSTKAHLDSATNTPYKNTHARTHARTHRNVQ